LEIAGASSGPSQGHGLKYCSTPETEAEELKGSEGMRGFEKEATSNLKAEMTTFTIQSTRLWNLTDIN